MIASHKKCSFVLLTAAALVIGPWTVAQARPVPSAAALRIERDIRPLLERGSVVGAVEAALRLDRRVAVIRPVRSSPATIRLGPRALRGVTGRLLGAVRRARALSRASLRSRESPRVALRALRQARQEIYRFHRGGPMPKLPDALRSDRIDHTKLGTAMMTIAAAIDAALPALWAYASKHSARTSAPVKGCDVIDALPALCVGSDAKNIYTKDAALQIDLGGDDLYLNDAGGADPLDGGSPVSVAIDIGGNDRYFTPSAANNHIYAAQGSGVLGGVGFLVDASGNDQYRRDEGAQGFGLLGGGVLADLGGNDTYLLDSRIGPFGTAQGGGFGGGPGFGVFVDSSGDDRFSAFAEGSFDKKKNVRNPTSAIGYGWALGGVALVWDGGGNDRADIVARNAGGIITHFAWAEGFGAALFPGTVAAVLSGDGPTVRRLVADMDGTTTPEPVIVPDGFGSGVGQGTTGIVADAGGNDVYEIRATNRTTQHNGGALVRGMGFGVIGNGVLRDVRGNDRYIFTVAARNNGARSGFPSAFSVGGVGVSGGGAGLVQDSGGNDLYSATVSNDRAVTMNVFFAAVEGVGPGGLLHDTGGADRYVAIAQPGGRFVYPGQWAAQASGSGGALVDVDTGDRDRFVVRPKETVCAGSRGGAQWIDCDSGGVGVSGP